MLYLSMHINIKIVLIINVKNEYSIYFSEFKLSDEKTWTDRIITLKNSCKCTIEMINNKIIDYYYYIIFYAKRNYESFQLKNGFESRVKCLVRLLTFL